MIAVDLSVIAWRQIHRSITAYGTWVKLQDGWRPALVLVRTGDEMSDHCVPCVVTMDKMWVWDEAIGDEAQAGRMIASFIDPLRITPDWANRLLSIIRDHIGDIVSMPPRPIVEQRVVAEAEVTDNSTGKTREMEIIENV